MIICKQQLIFSVLIFSICNGMIMAQDSLCGDEWEPYKDEKCFKIFDKVGSIIEAENTCRQQENTASLIIIRSKDEQDFLSNLLFSTHKIADGVWIGAKYTSNKFRWIDDSDLSFTNWAQGSPSNKTDHNCIQIESDGSSIGKWVDAPCNKNNKVVCQKMQNWSISRLQKTLLDARKELRDSLDDVRKQLNNQLTINDDQKLTIDNLKRNPVPIGFVYVQLPGQPSPTDLWSTVQWKDDSSEYSGLFFRVVGGGSAAFGEIQNENSPRLVEAEHGGMKGVGLYHTSVSANGQWSSYVETGGIGTVNGEWWHLRFKVSAGEVRPRNKAVRIWKRIK